MYKNNLPVYDERKCIHFALGRNAMYAACRALKLETGDEVLTPAFDCDNALQPFRVSGLKVRFFKSDPYSFCADIDDIKRKITPRTKLIHIINHFGMPQQWERLLSFREEAGIPILEDNAYSLFSKLNGRLFGTFGDVSIFSLRKNLPLADGGLLRINNPGYRFELERKDMPLFCLSDLPAMLKIIKDRVGFYRIPPTLRNLIKTIFPGISEPPPLYSEPGKGHPYRPSRDLIGREFSRDFLRPMSRLSRIGLNGFLEDDFEDAVKKKRHYYSRLSDALSTVRGIKILWPVLPEGVVPFCLSFLIFSDKRDAVLKSLQAKYYVSAWPTLSGEVLGQLENFPEVELLGRKLLQINLPFEKVRLTGFSRYIESLVRDIRNLLS